VNQDLRGQDGFALAHQALQELAERDLSASGPNYVVWTTHLSGSNDALSKAIADIEVQGARITDAALTMFFRDHVEPPSSDDNALEATHAADAHLKEVLDTLSELGADTAAYGATLNGAADALAAPPTATNLADVVRNLVQATSSMQSRTQELEQRLSDTSREMSELRTTLEKTRIEALTDPLTGAANRKRFDQTLEQAREHALSSNTPLSLVIGDIDHFKRINDTWGHQTGDHIIRFVAKTMMDTAGDANLVARYGGEEFAIVMPGSALPAAHQLAEMVRASIESKKLKRKSTNESLGTITVSFGVAELIGDEPHWKLVERADQALYESKNGGRNKVSSRAA